MGGYFVFGGRTRSGKISSVNQQIVIYVFARVVLALARIAVKPGEKELLAWANQFIDKAKSDGELDKINQKWLGEPMPAVLKKTSK